MLFWIPVGGWEIMARGWHPISIVGWFSLVWLALMSTVIAYLAWFKGLAKIDASAAASTLFIQPLLGTLLAVVFLQDQLTSMTIIGGVLIIVSVFLLSRY
jgi:drug/metabolite transporter (DMT)-like permease